MDQIRLTLTSPSQTYSHTTEKNSVKIGRALTCDFVIPKDDLSREQCLFEVINGEFFVTDLGSKNGVHVDRVKLEPNKPTKVTESSLIVLSNIYTLKINDFNIKTKIDMFVKPQPEKGTVTFQLDLPQEKSIGLVKPKRKKQGTAESVFADDNEPLRRNQEYAKMVVGFLVILGFILYQAFGS